MTVSPVRICPAAAVSDLVISRSGREQSLVKGGEKARLRERLKQIVAEYAEASSLLSKLEAELGFFLSHATSLAAG